MFPFNVRANGVMIGAGFFAEHQAEAWRRIDGVSITAVADIAPGKALEFAGKHGIPRAFESVEEMLDKESPDFVDIATRPESHFALIKLVASRRISIICQKPMAPTWEECCQMVEVCRQADVRLLIHENWRWQPWYREIRRIVDKGSLGRLFQMSFYWRTGDGRGPRPYQRQPYFRCMPRFLIYESLVHILDTFRFLGEEIDSVFCTMSRINPAIRGEDQAVIQVKFASGALGVIDANRISGPVPTPLAVGTLLLEGEQANLRMSPDGRLWFDDRSLPQPEIEYEFDSEKYRGDSVRATQQHLLDCLQQDLPCESDGAEYLKTVAAVEACYKSAEQGRVIPVTQ